jgi:hypothetical protein
VRARQRRGQVQRQVAGQVVKVPPSTEEPAGSAITATKLLYVTAGSSPDAGPGRVRWLTGRMTGAMRPLPIRDTRLARWRLGSGACAVADVVGAAAGASLYLVAGIDSMMSWPSNRVLLSDGDLSRVAAVLLIPSWPWLLVSGAMITDWDRRGRRRSARLTRAARLMRSPGETPPLVQLPSIRQWPAWARACLAAGAVVAVAVVAGGAAIGMSKGSVQVLPGPRYQVSTLDLNQADWTTVTASQFQLWQGRFVREDALFMFFGLAAVAGFVGLLSLRRRAGHAAAAGGSRS